MQLKHVALAAALAVVGVSASAQTSTFVGNRGIHEAEEFGSNTFRAGSSINDDMYMFELASNIASLESDVAFVGRPLPTGSISLYGSGDTLIGSYTFAQGTGAFGALLAGDYYYLVDASGPNGGGYTFGSFITAVPEPETYALMLAGLGIMAFVSRRRKA